MTKPHKVPDRFQNLLGDNGWAKRGFGAELIQKFAMPVTALRKTPIQIPGDILEYLLNAVVDIVNGKGCPRGYEIGHLSGFWVRLVRLSISINPFQLL